MRSLSSHLYQMENLKQDQLPVKTLEQGPDLLDILKDLENFSDNFSYDMTSLCFAEISSDDCKFLQTLCSRHIENTLRTHGLGIVKDFKLNTKHFLKAQLQSIKEHCNDNKMEFEKTAKNWRSQSKSKIVDVLKKLIIQFGKCHSLKYQLHPISAVLSRCR